MTAATAKAELARPVKPPRGMIWIDGGWQIRWAGFLAQRDFDCYNHHRIRIKKGGKVREGSIECGNNEQGLPCPARLFVFRTNSRILFAMDITEAEDNAISLAEMDLDEIIVHFGLSFPARVRR